jgi:RNA polymerase sigma factor (sigma-70 family)
LLLGVLRSTADAEDVLQEALLQAYLGLDQLRRPDRFGAWLNAIALNMARGQRRAQSRQAASLATEHESEAEIRAAGPQPEQWLQQRETQAGLERAVAELTDAEREAITLVYGEGLSHQETAHRLGVSLSAVKVRVHRGRQRLRMALESDHKPADIPSKSKRRKVIMIPVVVHDVLATQSPLDLRSVLAAQLAAMPEIAREPFLAAVTLNLEPRRPFAWGLHRSPDPSLTLTEEEQQAYEEATRSLWPQRIVLLKEKDGLRALPIWIGPFEADALVSRLMAQQTPRPLTADLMTSLLQLAGLRVERAIIGKLHDQVFYATLEVHTPEQSANIDCRPSDAINLAVRLGTPLFVAVEVMDQSSVMPNADGTYELGKKHDERKAYHSLMHSL